MIFYLITFVKFQNLWYNFKGFMEVNMFEIDKSKFVHCVGIGGIGMSAIAEVLLSRGYKISGSDMNESLKTKELEKKGAVIQSGHEALHVKNAQLVIYTAAASLENPELLYASKNNIKTLSRSEMLGELMKDEKISIAVAGTHGKTSTTSMVSLILENSGKNPTILVGGNLAEINGNMKVGNGDYFVTEACEYMDSFLSLCPNVEIILNIDSDHLDYFKDIDHITDSFDAFVEILPKKDGLLIAYEANPFVNRVMKKANNLVTFGLNNNCDYWAKNISFNHSGMPKFDIFYATEKLCSIELSVPGEFNILNALAAAACCHTLGVDISYIKNTLESYTGIERRFDVQGVTKNGLTVIDDYAHHPTEIKSTLSAIKNMAHNESWCLFQPHTYTRTLALFDAFPESFEDADNIVFADIYAAREKNIYGVTSEQLMKAVKKRFPDKGIWHFETFEEIANHVYQNGEKGDLVLTMGAGDIFKVGEMILEKN